MDQPTGMQLIAYVVAAGSIFTLAYMRRAPAGEPARQRASVSAQ
jgi:hypothetical protein